MKFERISLHIRIKVFENLDFMRQDIKRKMLCRRAEGTRVIQILKKIQERLENENA